MLRTSVCIGLDSDSAVQRWLNFTVRTSVSFLLSQDFSYASDFWLEERCSEFLDEVFQFQFQSSLYKLCSILHWDWSVILVPLCKEKKNLRMETYFHCYLSNNDKKKTKKTIWELNSQLSHIQIFFWIFIDINTTLMLIFSGSHYKTEPV